MRSLAARKEGIATKVSWYLHLRLKHAVRSALESTSTCIREKHFSEGFLNRFAAALAGANADAIIHGQDKDLSVTDLACFAGAAAFQDCIDRGLHKRFIDRNLQLHFA